MPVRAGDTIRAVTEVTGIRPSKSKPDFGIINFTTTAYNQRGEVVFVRIPTCGRRGVRAMIAGARVKLV
ncbi:MAG: hypothetical protein WDO18_03740 [Acidobacteriota bacterium]